MSDTLFVRFDDHIKISTIVENGVIFELSNGKKRKANYYYEITYNFGDNRNFFSQEKRYLDKNFLEYSTCQSIPELVVYKDKIGILFIEMLGQSFSEIQKLSDVRLIMDNGKEYQKME